MSTFDIEYFKSLTTKQFEGLDESIFETFSEEEKKQAYDVYCENCDLDTAREVQATFDGDLGENEWTRLSSEQEARVEALAKRVTCPDIRSTFSQHVSMMVQELYGYIVSAEEETKNNKKNARYIEKVQKLMAEAPSGFNSACMALLPIGDRYGTLDLNSNRTAPPDKIPEFPEAFDEALKEMRIHFTRKKKEWRSETIRQIAHTCQYYQFSDKDNIHFSAAYILCDVICNLLKKKLDITITPSTIEKMARETNDAIKSEKLLFK